MKYEIISPIARSLSPSDHEAHQGRVSPNGCQEPCTKLPQEPIWLMTLIYLFRNQNLDHIIF